MTQRTIEQLLFGDKLTEAVQHIVCRAVRKRTPEAYGQAADCLGGILCLIVHLEIEGDREITLRLSNAQHQMWQMESDTALRDSVHTMIDAAEAARARVTA